MNFFHRMQRKYTTSYKTSDGISVGGFSQCSVWADSHRTSPYIQQFFFLWVPEPVPFPSARNPARYIEYPSLSSEFHQLLGSTVSDQIPPPKAPKQVRGSSLHREYALPRETFSTALGSLFFLTEAHFLPRVGLLVACRELYRGWVYIKFLV